MITMVCLLWAHDAANRKACEAKTKHFDCSNGSNVVSMCCMVYFPNALSLVLKERKHRTTKLAFLQLQAIFRPLQWQKNTWQLRGLLACKFAPFLIHGHAPVTRGASRGLQPSNLTVYTFSLSCVGCTFAKVRMLDRRPQGKFPLSKQYFLGLLSGCWTGDTAVFALACAFRASQRWAQQSRQGGALLAIV